MKHPLTTNSLQSQDDFWENQRNNFLVALYEQDYLSVETIYTKIFKTAISSKNFDENTQKILNQIQTIFKKFKPELPEQTVLKLQIYHTQLSHFLSDYTKDCLHNVQYINLSEWENRIKLSAQQKNLIYKTTMTFQLTSGCSNFCRRCNEWALAGVRSHFSYSAIITIIKCMSQQKNDEVSLFGASDPLDWQHNDNTLIDIIDCFKKYPIGYSILTKIPKGKESLLKHLINQETNLSISVTSKNKTRVKKIQTDVKFPLSKQHETDDLMIPAGLDEDFSSVKPSITDGYGTEITPDGAFIIIPTFTSALHPFGHKKIPVTSNTRFFPEKKTGRHALLVDYFKPLKGYDLAQKPCYLAELLNVQIENIILDTGIDELTPPGMRSVKEYLSIFENKARIQRKKMTPAVLKRLKKKFLSNCKFKDLPDLSQSNIDRTSYVQEITHHLDLCKKEKCLNVKLHTLSFFLKAIWQYVQKNPIKVQMIKFLLKDETDQNKKIFTNIDTSEDLTLIFSDSQIDSFNAFRCLIHSLLTHTENLNISKFINRHPVIYDPSSDIFLSSSKQI